jgi:ABC-type Co2+ transport system permease subunit
MIGSFLFGPTAMSVVGFIVLFFQSLFTQIYLLLIRHFQTFLAD